MEQQKVTIKDVADLAGVSKSTVSRYLNNGYISMEKQAKVRKAIEATGFQSNFFAKRLEDPGKQADWHCAAAYGFGDCGETPFRDYPCA